MFGSNKSDERLIKLSCLHLGLLAPSSFVREQSIGKLVGAKVHVCLMVIVLAGRRTQQGESQRCVVRLIPSILTVREDRYAIAVGRVTLVGPLIATHLVLIACTDAATNGTKRDVVGGTGILESRSIEGEVDLQHALVCLPVHLVNTLYAVVDGIHADVLNEGRAFLLTLNLQRFAQRAILYKFYLDVLRYIRRRRTTHVSIAYLPCWPGILVVIDELLPNS